ncbi:hypothetical protein AN393_01735 [Pseudoalteromonas sp. P1-25]|nr:hypothetical protein AN393_01735 [Pseudoalteromonas sp. P1-25]
MRRHDHWILLLCCSLLLSAASLNLFVSNFTVSLSYWRFIYRYVKSTAFERQQAARLQCKVWYLLVNVAFLHVKSVAFFKKSCAQREAKEE